MEADSTAISRQLTQVVAWESQTTSPFFLISRIKQFYYFYVLHFHRNHNSMESNLIALHFVQRRCRYLSFVDRLSRKVGSVSTPLFSLECQLAECAMRGHVLLVLIQKILVICTSTSASSKN